MKKLTFYTEVSYFAGLALISLGAALMAKSDFGVSMVVAPAYLLHRKLSLYHPIFSFGFTEVLTQVAVLFLLWIILRRIKASDLFCFISAVLYGMFLDGWVTLCGSQTPLLVPIRILLFVFGMGVCAAGVACIFHTYLPGQSYDYFVKRLSEVFRIPSGKVKTGYDLSSLGISLCFAYIFFGFGSLVGIGPGTIICAFLNGTLISLFSKFLEKCFVFKDGLSLRKYFVN